ncbi:WH2 domain containing protein [Trichuris trichiura]|uniref:Wiskott-Aldrich syndrome protein family member n=1 Tax=Trichuris trichiura TaxID=36087 RepID=A0A077ZHH4_TRITR|nr:WH2 domain containing protein [Trichuris trichiura]
MPVTKRDISPVGLSRHRLPPSVRTEELECVSNGTLANLIRQLSSLSAHAEDVFGELYMETVKVQHKTAMLSGRLEALSAKVGQLDSALDERTRCYANYYAFKRSPNLAFDQQPLSRHTLPAAMSQRYERGEPPPDLEKLNGFREDGKNALKFYTDPDYFFELWRQEMLKDPENSRKVKVVSHSRPDGLPPLAEKFELDYDPRQKTYNGHCAADRRNRDVGPFMSTHLPSIDHRHGSWSAAAAAAVTVRDSDHYMCTASSSSSSVIYGSRRSPSRPTQPPPLPPTDMPDTSVMEMAAFRGSSMSPDLPPPPPPLTNFSLNSAVLSSSSADQPTAVETFHCKGNANELGIGSPPPPPPPPLLMPNGSIYSGSLGGSTESGSSCSNTAAGSKSSSTQATGNENASKNVTQQAASIDTRSDLLRAIRQGIQLKKVNREEEQQRENDAVMAGHDVAAILKRRMELVRGCSESEDSASEEPDEWDD